MVVEYHLSDAISVTLSVLYIWYVIYMLTTKRGKTFQVPATATLLISCKLPVLGFSIKADS